MDGVACGGMRFDSTFDASKRGLILREYREGRVGRSSFPSTGGKTATEEERLRFSDLRSSNR